LSFHPSRNGIKIDGSPCVQRQLPAAARFWQ
jgi:hypothetical protein